MSRPPINFHQTTLNSLDLDLENYSLDDLYNLFNIQQHHCLDEETMKSAKHIVLKMHPDKSHLDAKYFLFFSKAYKRLYSIYEFQNKSKKPSTATAGAAAYHSFDGKQDEKHIVDQLMKKDPAQFHSFFNQSFEKRRLEDPNEQGYGEWLKSDEGFINIEETVTDTNRNDVFERKKKQMQAMTVYTGVSDMSASTFGASLLNGQGGGGSTEYYTDLREAYSQTLIPVTMDDYHSVKKYKNVNEYIAHRDGDQQKLVPLSKEEAERKLLYQQKQAEHESAALAFKYAQEAEKNKKNQKGFWAEIKQLTGW